MTNTAAVLLNTARAAMHSPRLDERERAAKYEAGIMRLIAEVEGIVAMSQAERLAARGAANPRGRTWGSEANGSHLKLKPGT